MANSAEAVAETATAPRTFDPLPGALQELFRALHKTAMYPPGHPIIRGTITRASDLLNMALEERASVLVAVARDHLLVDRQPIPNAPTVLNALAQFLHSLDVGVLEIRAGLSADELESFLFRLREARREGRAGAALAVALAEDKLRNVRIFPLDYWGLEFTAPSEAKPTGEAGTRIWEGLVVNLTDLASGRPEIAPENLAREANARYVNDEGVGGGLLRDQFQELGARMGTLDAWQREALRTRLVRFVGALNPTLRQDLLRVDPMHPERSVSTIAELSEALPDDTLIDVLRDLNKSGQRAHDQFLNFVNKMARLPKAGDGAALPDLVGVLQRWGVSGKVDEDAGAFRTALREVFIRRKNVESNPETYQDLLDELTHRELLPEARILCSRYVDPWSPAEVRAQVTRLALVLLKDGHGLERAPGILAHLGATAEALLDDGQFQPVRDAVVAARELCAQDDLPDDVKRAASGFLEDFRLEPRVNRILDHALQEGEVHCAVEPLLQLGGAAALDRILDRLDGRPAPALTAVLQNIAVTMGRGALEEVLAKRKAHGFDRLRPVFRMLKLLPPAEALGLLDHLDAHQESRVRLAVLTCRCDLDRAPGGPERHLRQALDDPDPKLVGLAIDELGERDGREATEVLAAFVEGETSAEPPPAALVERAAEALISRGDVGLHRLCGSLHRLRRSLSPARAAVGAAVRLALEPHQGDPVVAKALSRWRSSPAALLARVLPPGRPEGGGA